MTAQPRPSRRRPPADPDRMSLSEVRALMRQSFQRPLPEVEPLHVMARRRADLARDTTETTRGKEAG